MPMDGLTFNEQEIQALFGHEAAENESTERLQQYYFKNNAYKQVVADLPLRLLVGHKGIGKSALFQVAMAEEQEAEKLTVLIRPDDIAGFGGNTSDFLAAIRDWKTGIIELIARKVFSTTMAIEGDGWRRDLGRRGGKLVDFLVHTFQNNLAGNLPPAHKAIVDRFLKKQVVYVYIDDLDRGWQGRPQDISRLSALLNAVRDISTENNGIYFRISMRSDVYFLVRTSDESTDKIEGSVIWHSWTNHEIFVLWVKRIESFFGNKTDDNALKSLPQHKLADYLSRIIEPRFEGKGHWQDAPMYKVFMSLVRRRPRDLVKLCTLAARHSSIRNGNKITTRDLENSFEEYSQGRLQDTINEFRSELPDIERLLMNMKPNRKERTAKKGYVYSTDELLRKIQNIMEQGVFRRSNNSQASPKDLAAFMYKINFLTARKDSGRYIERKYFEENRYLSSAFADFGFDWEIHPAYRWALQPDDVASIFDQLEISSDET